MEISGKKVSEAVWLSRENSFEMRKLLAKNGYDVYLFNAVTGDLETIKEDYSTEKIVYVDGCLSFLCLYNGEKRSPRKVRDTIEESHENGGCVTKYRFEGK